MINVLIVDDDFMVAQIHTRFVERTEGFCVIGSAATGETALAEIERLDPELVLLDIHLPDLTGLEVLRRLRAKGKETGIIMITAAREADSVRAALAGGASSYLIKPFEYSDFVARLDQFRESHLALSNTKSPVQGEVDAYFARSRLGTDDVLLPKGLSVTTAQSVLETLAAGAEMSASDCADQVGLSRVSARRYLEHFVKVGQAEVRLKYGTAGRPQRLYRSKSPE
jgi:response regulator of citrate/malate metabolism